MYFIYPIKGIDCLKDDDGKMIKAIGVVNSEPVLTENSPLEDDLEDNVSKMGDWQNRESTSFITVGVEVFQLPIYIPIEDISLEEKERKTQIQTGEVSQ